MKLAKCLLAAALLASISSFLVPSFQERPDVADKDGVDWDEFSDSNKLYFISGFICGANLAIKECSVSESYFKDATYKKLFEEGAGRLQLIDMTVGQIKDGINNFYKDFGNRRVKVIDAIYIVKMQIMGEEQVLINEQIRYLRMQPVPDEVANKILDKWEVYCTQKGHNPTYQEIQNGDFSYEELLKVGFVITSDNDLHFLFCYGKYE